MNSHAAQLALAVTSAVPGVLLGRWSVEPEALQCCEATEEFEQVVGRSLWRLEDLARQLTKRVKVQEECRRVEPEEDNNSESEFAALGRVTLGHLLGSVGLRILAWVVQLVRS